MAVVGQSVALYDLTTYTFGQKTERHEKDKSVQARLQRWEDDYHKEGMRCTVEGVLLVHQHNHPHILLLQVGNSFFKLPGGKLRPGEGAEDGLKRKLTSKLAPEYEGYTPDWQPGELLCSWWRPHFDQTVYPYVPPHITSPKECRQVFLVPLPDKCYFAVPKNLKLLAVPLFDLYENAQRYGPVIAGLPQLLSRFNFNYM
eukprot:TRINITY_DN6940_c0_g1_i1.p1 TRINITY_DN6940_c0_g1~~TRINITY_DN6940_c0_g1_i1.p1  ORF type:complete len:200 (+),score=50.47 TRINITY_DN6940_c0_g1_i1:168-767(+)